MAITSNAAVIDVLDRTQIILPNQLDEVRKSLQKQLPDPQSLMQELVQRDWLTSFQARQIVIGRGADLLLGNYLLLDTLGSGGFGQVFKARHRLMNRVVALKVLRPDQFKDPEVVTRFYREIEVASQLVHPNIVHAYEAGRVGPWLILVMEHVDGLNFEQLVKKSGPLPLSRCCEYIRQAAEGLHYAYQRGLVHRDIKPANLLLSRTDNGPTVKLLDLGLARLLEPGKRSQTANLTMISSKAVMQGTPDYMAPEQALDFHTADARSDIYSLGCTFYFLLAGQPPFPGGTLAQKLMRHQQAEPPLAALRAQLPAGLENVLRRMLAKQPDQRYQTPGAVVTALRPFCTATGRRRLAVAGWLATAGRWPLLLLYWAWRALRYGEGAARRLVRWGLQPQRRRWFLTLSGSGLALMLAAVLFLWSPGYSSHPLLPETMRPAESATVKVTAYRDKFQGPEPAPGWRYLWNQRGQMGDPANYDPLQWNGADAYTVDGGKELPRPGNGGFLNLSRDGGHPGYGIAQVKADFYAFAAYTIQPGDGSGPYRITDSTISKGNRLEVVVQVNHDLPAWVQLVPSGAQSMNFDAILGNRKPGDIIYVGVGPAGDSIADNFENFDFAISRGARQDSGAKTVVLREGFDKPTGWDRGAISGPVEGTFEVDPEVRRKSNPSFRITVPAATVPRMQFIRHLVDNSVSPRDVYRATAWVRTNGAKENLGAFICLRFAGNDDKVMGMAFSKAIKDNETNAWEQLEVEAITPVGAQKLFVFLHLNSRGSAWFDEVEITRERTSKSTE